MPTTDRDLDLSGAVDPPNGMAARRRAAGDARWRRRARRLPQYAVVLLTAVLVGGFALRSALMLWQSHHQILSGARAVLDSQARAGEVATDRTLAAIDALLRSIATSRPAAAPPAEQAPDRLLHRFHAERFGIRDVLILDAAGRRVNGSGDYAHAPFFTAQQPAPGLFVGAAQGGSLMLSRPLPGAGVIAAEVPAATFAELLQAIRGPGESEIALLGDDGSVIAVVPGDGGAPSPAALAKLLARGPEAALAESAADRLDELRRVPGYRLIVAASRNRRSLLQHWTDECIVAVLVLLIVALTAAILSRLIVRALGRHQLAVARLRRSEARLRRQSRLLQTTLDNIGEGLSVFSRGGRLLAWNARFCNLLELPHSVLAGATLREILTVQAERGDFGPRPAQEEADRRVALFYRDVPTVKERVMPGGRILQIRRHPMPDGGVVSVYADISEIKASERKLIEMRRQAELANRAKSDFLANMSHELRTPLNAIIGFSEMISAEIFGPVLEKRQLEYIRDIHSSGLHLLSIINDVLDMSKIEAGKLELASETVILQQVVAEAVRMVSEQADSRQLVLDIAMPAAAIALDADRRAIKQIVLNLLSNAVKFSHPGGRIEVRGWLDLPASVVLEVEDHGIGMAENDIERALQPFAQTRAVTTKAYGGTGLGLPITKGLVAAHGGELTITSRLGIGTRVRIVLPQRAAPPTDPDDQLGSASPEAPTRPAAA